MGCPEVDGAWLWAVWNGVLLSVSSALSGCSGVVNVVLVPADLASSPRTLLPYGVKDMSPDVVGAV